MNNCTKCLAPVMKFASKSRRCQKCRTAAHRDYCKRVDYGKKRYTKLAPQERERHLIRKYGVTQADYDRIFQDQGGKCAICEKTQDRAFDVDHDHISGRVRGLLCTNCNRMVGHAHDDAARLRKAAEYLEVVPQVAAEFVKAYMECCP
jgi:hypothetical protein